MDALDDGTLILTTEDRAGLARRVLLLLKVNSFLILMTALITFGPRPMDFHDIKFLAGWDAFFFALSLLGSFCSRGIWRIDLQRIVYHPIFGATRELAWDSIARVRCDESSAMLEGNGVTIPLNWTMFPKPVAVAARHRIEKFLAKDFDLSPFPPQRKGDFFWAIIRSGFCRVMVFPIFTAVYFAVTIYLIYSPGMGGHFLLQCWMILAFLVPLWIQSKFFEQERRRWLHVEPDWPWRRRKSFQDEMLNP